MSDIGETISEAVERASEGNDRFMSMIALLVALLATTSAIFNIKGSNIVQAMSAVQSQSVNAWAYYQSKSTKQNIAENMLDQLKIERELLVTKDASIRELLERKIASYQSTVTRYETEKGDIKKKAEAFEAQYEALNVHDDQLDIAEACITVGISLLGVAALTRRRWLVAFALMFAGLGVASGFAEFAGIAFRIDFIAKLLS